MNRLDQLRRKVNRLSGQVWRLKSYIAALTIFSLGVVGVSVVLLIEEGYFEWLHLLRDASITAMISAVLILIYERWVRESFLQDAKDSLKGVYEEQQQFDEVGLEKVHPTFPEELLTQGFESAKKIRILQTWLGFENRRNTILKMVGDALSKRCKIKILLLDPLSGQVPYRAKAVGCGEDAAKNNIKKDLKALCDLKESEYGDRLEVRVYDAAPTFHMYEFDDTMLTAIKGEGDSIYDPQLELKSNLPFAQSLDEYFDYLWDDEEDSDLNLTKEEYDNWQLSGLTWEKYQSWKRTKPEEHKC